MQDIYIQYGLIIVGVTAIIILMTFGYQTLNKTAIIPQSYEQEFEGTSHSAEVRINGMCEICTHKKYYNQECFLLNLQLTEGNLNITSETLSPGRYILKISNKDAKCEIKMLS